MKKSFAKTALLSVSVIVGSLYSAETKASQSLTEGVVLGVGTKFRAWDQDPLVGEMRTVFFPGRFAAGPSTVDGMIQIAQDPATLKNGDFVNPKYSPDQVDSIHTFAVVKDVYDMYSKDLHVLMVEDPSNNRVSGVSRAWDGGSCGPLKIYPHAGEEANAFYNRDGSTRELKFFHFRGNDHKVVKTCQSRDIVAHEAGHWMLDQIHPEYFDASSLQTGGFHEAFGDMTAIYDVLAKPRLCEQLILDTKGDLHQPNFLSKLAEQFGVGLGNTNGLRNADDDINIQGQDEVHDVSRVFTGAIYDTLVDAFKGIAPGLVNRMSVEKILEETGKHFRQTSLLGIVNDTHREPSFADLAYSISTAMEQRRHLVSSPFTQFNWTGSLSAQFGRRGVLVQPSSGTQTTTPTKVEKRRICGTAHIHFGEKS